MRISKFNNEILVPGTALVENNKSGLNRNRGSDEAPIPEVTLYDKATESGKEERLVALTGTMSRGNVSVPRSTKKSIKISTLNTNANINSNINSNVKKNETAVLTSPNHNDKSTIMKQENKSIDYHNPGMETKAYNKDIPTEEKNGLDTLVIDQKHANAVRFDSGAAVKNSDGVYMDGKSSDEQNNEKPTPPSHKTSRTLPISHTVKFNNNVRMTSSAHRTQPRPKKKNTSKDKYVYVRDGLQFKKFGKHPLSI